MKILDEILKIIFKDIVKELFEVNKIYFLISTILALGIPSYLASIKIGYSLFVFSYPITQLVFLMVYNRIHRIELKCIGIRNGEIPTISKPNFPFTKVVGAKRICIVYNSELEFTDIKTQINKKLGNLKHIKDIYYYGLVSVPINAAIGYKIGQKRKIHIYNFDRTKGEWLQIANFDTSIKMQITKKNGTIRNQVNIVLPFSYPIDMKKINNNYDTYIIKNNNEVIDLDSSYSYIVNQITDVINKYEKVHFFASINNGFAFYLGMRLNDSNLPSALFYEYGGSKNKIYIYSLNVNTLEIQKLK